MRLLLQSPIIKPACHPLLLPTNDFEKEILKIYCMKEKLLHLITFKLIIFL